MPEQDFQRHFLHYNKGSASEKKRSFKNENLVIYRIVLKEDFPRY